MFQTLGSGASLVRACYRIRHDAAPAKILDVGSGSGSSLDMFRCSGYRPEHSTGIDIQTERLLNALKLYQHVRFVHGDTTNMTFASGEFEIVFESTMFATLADPGTRTRVAEGMLRVCKPGCFLILMDWRIRKPRSPQYGVLARRDVRQRFRLGLDTDLVTVDAARWCLLLAGRFRPGSAPYTS